MTAESIKVLRSESHNNIAGVLKDREHLEHRSPLSVVADVERPRLRQSWSKSFVNLANSRSMSMRSINSNSNTTPYTPYLDGDMSLVEGGEVEATDEREEDKKLSDRILFWDSNDSEERQAELTDQANKAEHQVLLKAALRGPLETRLAMTSRVAFFNDRIISPSMVRSCHLFSSSYPRHTLVIHSSYTLYAETIGLIRMH
jgi:hypothetical protein